IAVIFAFIQCCYAETIINTPEKFQHFVYEAGWRANAGYYDDSPRKDKWYNDKIYEDSIYKVIPQAVADCMQGKAEFENVGTIVTFEAKDHTGYSPENWNAVVLWNYLEYAIHNGGALSNDGVSEVGKKLKTYYAQDYWDYINTAVSDIQTYATDLNLYDYIKEVQTNQNNNKYYTVIREFKQRKFEMWSTHKGSATIRFPKQNVEIYLKHGQEDKLRTAASKNTTPKTKDEITWIGYRVMSDDIDGIWEEIYLTNLVMRILYNSESIHKLIKRLHQENNKQDEPSYWVQRIFYDLRAGDFYEATDDIAEMRKSLNIPKSDDELNRTQRIMQTYKNIIRLLREEAERKGKNAIDLRSMEISEYITLKGKIYKKGSSVQSTQYNMYLGVDEGEESIQETIKNYEKMLGIKQRADGASEFVSIMTMPKLIAFYRDKYNADLIETQNIIETAGKKYKLIGVVDGKVKDPKTYSVRINTESGWYKVGHDVERREPNAKSYSIQIAFYERVE
ncbi:MAG: hypothetical protein IJS10_03280, partial [Alphaproteobacteria bacterium]|nr:hypothetical protein [Alphaproteobacteria bacterium]